MVAQAIEPAVRGVHAPRILHIATHGLFLQDVHLQPPTSGSSEARGVFAREQDRSKLVGAAEAERLPGEVGAMNRSALVFADVRSAYLRGDAARDGLLMADEARSLNLDGTQLVVLLACETGRGGLSAGQGVYGLRRAFLTGRRPGRHGRSDAGASPQAWTQPPVLLGSVSGHRQRWTAALA